MTKRQSGLSLLELLLTISISAVLFTISTNLVTSLLKTDTKSKSTQSLEQTKISLTQELSTKIKWGENISYNQNSITIDGVRYELQGGRILKGGQPLTSANIEVQNLNIKNLSANEDTLSLEILIPIKHKEIANLEESIKITASQRRTEIKQERK